MHNGDSISLQVCTRISFPFCKFSNVQCNFRKPRTLVRYAVGLGPRRDRGTQCIVQTVDVETETDHKSTNRFSVSLLITFPHHVTKLPNIHSVGRWGGGEGGDGVQPSHKMRFTSDQGTYYTGILYMRQQSSSPGHPSTADEAWSRHVLHSWWFMHNFKRNQ